MQFTRASAVTVTQLKDMCEELIKRGHGDKEILMTSDDEGNSYHALWTGFVTDKRIVKSCEPYFDSCFSPDDVVLLE